MCIAFIRLIISFVFFLFNHFILAMPLSLNYAQFGFLFQNVGFCVCLCLSFTPFSFKYETSCGCLYVKRNARNRINRVLSTKQACNCVSLMHLIVAQNSKLKLTVNNLLPPKKKPAVICSDACATVYVCMYVCVWMCLLVFGSNANLIHQSCHYHCRYWYTVTVMCWLCIVYIADAGARYYRSIYFGGFVC